jgi:predicted dehydrogenase
MLKIGVLGAGHLGKIHLRLLQQSDQYELVGFMIPIKKMQKRFRKNLDTNILVPSPLFTQ